MIYKFLLTLKKFLYKEASNCRFREVGENPTLAPQPWVNPVLTLIKVSAGGGPDSLSLVWRVRSSHTGKAEIEIRFRQAL